MHTAAMLPVSLSSPIMALRTGRPQPFLLQRPTGGRAALEIVAGSSGRGSPCCSLQGTQNMIISISTNSLHVNNGISSSSGPTSGQRSVFFSSGGAVRSRFAATTARSSQGDKETAAEPTPKQALEKQLNLDRFIIAAFAVGLASVATLCATVWQDPIRDWLLDTAPTMTVDGEGMQLGIGDVVGASLWSLSMYFTTPVQILSLFLGRVDTDRPSDWILRRLGLAAGLPVDDLEYSPPAWAQALTVGSSIATGTAIAVIFSQGLGDATWSVSTGIGACFAAGTAEVGRPRRLSVDEAVRLEGQWQDFVRFADVRLQRAGRCHESEVFNAFRREFAKYRREEVLSDEELRSMIRNWHRDAERTSKGFFKNLSVVARLDPFTGEAMGSPRLREAVSEQAEPTGTGQAQPTPNAPA